MRLSLGPNLFYWSKEDTLAFYRDMVDTAIDIFYLGEAVCSKRKQMRTQDWFDLADELQSKGKEVVLSTLALNEADSDIKTMKRICDNEKFMVEANDMGAVSLLEGKAFVTGHSVNTYNQHTIKLLAGLGLKRWVMPLELSKETLADLLAEKPAEVEAEIFAFGRIPLAYSARCYTARAHNLQKDDCQYRCIDYPDGMLLNTQEEQKFLNLNGIQTLSAQTYNLLPEIETMKQMGVDILRLSPQYRHMNKVIDLFDQCNNQQLSINEANSQLEKLLTTDSCNGYWYGDAGIASKAS
ncbi:MAG: U32 family peptidase [Gammaproteobacteria bacterium]|nr:U32 family peptidase [Gammaproteobacteria bacterium]